MTDYERTIKSIRAFKNMLESRVTYAFDQRDEHDNEKPFDIMYREKFTLSYMGKSCSFYFGASEYHAIINALEMIIDEM